MSICVGNSIATLMAIERFCRGMEIVLHMQAVGYTVATERRAIASE